MFFLNDIAKTVQGISTIEGIIQMRWRKEKDFKYIYIYIFNIYIYNIHTSMYNISMWCITYIHQCELGVFLKLGSLFSQWMIILFFASNFRQYVTSWPLDLSLSMEFEAHASQSQIHVILPRLVERDFFLMGNIIGFPTRVLIEWKPKRKDTQYEYFTFVALCLNIHLI